MAWTVMLDIRLIAETKTWPVLQRQQLRAAQRVLGEVGPVAFNTHTGLGKRLVIARYPTGIFTLHLDVQSADALIIRWASYFPNPEWQ